ncbi:MAG TPA: trimethylamine methyltransferase family protein [bacterium]|nr:trimethylamine methyltransferase family protein [bacterium]
MNVFSRMTVLSDNQIEQFQKATEDILENTGFSVEHAELLQIARKAGAKVEEAGSRVRIPAPLLRDLLAQVPRTFRVRGAVGNEFTIGTGTPYFLAIVTDPWIIDYKTQQPRRPCLSDLRRHTTIAQQLDAVAMISRMDFPVTDCDDATSSLRALEVHLLNHTKHNLVCAASVESMREWLDLMRILNRGSDLKGSGLMTCAVGILSPLTLKGLNGDLLLDACKYDFTVSPTICPMAGTTAPYSLASTLLQANCEAVFTAALTQMVNPGNPYFYTMGLSVSDMRSGHDLYYTLDKVLWKIAGVQLAKSYGIPCTVECGGTLTYRCDPQNGAEGILFMLGAFASGGDILAGLGSCHNANGMSAEMMVIQQAWFQAAQFLGRGIRTDDLRLGIENIRQAGPGAHFLEDDLTLKFLRGDEFFKNEIFDFGGGYEPSLSMLERAHEKVENMTADYRSPVPESIQEDLRRYFHDLYVRKASRPN